MTKVVTICGSMRFFNDMLFVASILTELGIIVLAPFSVVNSTLQGSSLKRKLDELHVKKIDMSEAIAVIRRGGYVGESTTREIEYAESLGKDVYYYDF